MKEVPLERTLRMNVDLQQCSRNIDFRMSQLKVRFPHKAPGLTLGSLGGSALVEGCGNVRS